MKTVIEKIPAFIFVPVAVALLYLCIWAEKIYVVVQEKYYKLAKIPYHKQSDKFNPHLIRLDKNKKG